MSHEENGAERPIARKLTGIRQLDEPTTPMVSSMSEKVPSGGGGTDPSPPDTTARMLLKLLGL
jgi:hypothetical protein